MEGSAKITPEQLNAMLYYMEQHSEFAANRLLGANGKESKKAQWQRLADFISSCGPTKDIKQLQTVWSRQRSKAKEYNAEKVRAARQTGNYTEFKFIENPQMEKILKIVGTTHKNGLEILPEVGMTPSNLKRMPKKKNNIVYELPLSLTTIAKTSPVTTFNEIKMKDASFTRSVTRPLHPTASASISNSESAATPVNNASSTTSATPALHQSASASGSRMEAAATPANNEASTTSVTPALRQSESVSGSSSEAAATPSNAVINSFTRQALHHSAYVSASTEQAFQPAAHHSKPYRISASPSKYTTRSSSRVIKLLKDTQSSPSNYTSEMEETKENKLSKSLEYSKIYSSYASSWRNNAKASQDDKKQVALAAVAENSNSINKLVETMHQLKEVETTKCDIFRRHFEKKEQYYEEKLKLWRSKN